eukprot:CAMPEP_0176396086 /NCGR_PEP_ID=MMETSP0126-20121128/43935_1 /TAXON_ID=141414 ORGANISM="Strombidinopsis acuminatum, Strain SPMC142" /NCGR_SAMPLE_ID=MMETSP0126 /ASSEMBLY_ACC=CAM_ASM_000229 /LENGTH=46 /DNA_ID= /DNA_START= /DNA_END= /DNA_ORIENTATION=
MFKKEIAIHNNGGESEELSTKKKPNKAANKKKQVTLGNSQVSNRSS